eukprot:TRINITY_DN1500_c0_g1_i18.p1 TRINITY_DN1500_c0_g1~~TRINITY_DN1500_c0_g1_i18.p1  ORF type:complete len:161 (+),score=13.21 TRINITY_DN1500_c0_g1_i18:85-567(+)
MRSVAKYMFFLAAVSNSALAARITTVVQTKPSGGDKSKPDGKLDCTNLEAQLGHWLSTFNDDCGVRSGDINIMWEEVLDTTRICAEQCRRQPLFHQKPPTLAEIEHCDGSYPLGWKIVNLMYSGFQKCSDKPSNPVTNSFVDVKSTDKNLLTYGHQPASM